MEWLGKEVNTNTNRAWTHQHDDGGWWHHVRGYVCTNPGMPAPTQQAWGYLSDLTGPPQLVSIYSEEEAVRLAELYPQVIYFFAGAVSHPLS